MLSNDKNPYEVLNVDISPPGGEIAVQNWYAVEGDRLVCGPAVQLPPICICTGTTEDLELCPVQAQFGSFRLVIIQRTCSIEYFVSRKEHKRRGRISLLLLCGFLLSGLMILAGIVLESLLVVILSLFLVIIAFVMLITFSLTQSVSLKITRYEAPGVFRIKGFPKPFLALLATHNISDQEQT